MTRALVDIGREPHKPPGVERGGVPVGYYVPGLPHWLRWLGNYSTPSDLSYSSSTPNAEAIQNPSLPVPSSRPAMGSEDGISYEKMKFRASPASFLLVRNH